MCKAPMLFVSLQLSLDLHHFPINHMTSHFICKHRASHLKIEGDLKIDRAGLRRRSVRDRPRELLCTAYFVYRIRIAAYYIVRIAAYYIVLI